MQHDQDVLGVCQAVDIHSRLQPLRQSSAAFAWACVPTGRAAAAIQARANLGLLLAWNDTGKGHDQQAMLCADTS